MVLSGMVGGLTATKFVKEIWIQTREALSVCELILGVCGILITSFSIYLCSLALFYECCKMSPQVTYMVNYRIDENQTNGARIDIRNTMAMDIITSQPELTSQEVTYNIRY
ncbi:hypothetical protein LSAT2_015744 [Lamellibrachia satsuma]|nr:hypothetical protein LSAT2_015744 [Lamellibrachia satsuma]